MCGSRNFRQGRVQVSLTKKSSDFFFFSPQLILQKSNGQFQRNLLFFKVPEGVEQFPGGGGGGSNFLQGGGGSGPPVPPLDPHLLTNW